MAELRLGGRIDPTTGERSGSGAPDLTLDTDELTTHGIIVGMTGSGKTGLGVVLVEEILTAGVPCLLIDPKGDLTNLCLTFPGLAAAEFRPWIEPSAAQAAGQTDDEFAAAQAQLWSDGLAGWEYGTDDIARLRTTTDFTVYTPGSAAGVGLDIVGSLDVPATDDEEIRADQIEGFVTGLLALVGIDADPLGSREHVLLSNLVHHAWSQGQNLDLPTLVGQVQKPPIVQLGVIELEEFFPERDRRQFAVKLNGLLAAPSFAAWGRGAALDIQSLLFTADGKPRCAIVTTAHLDDNERQFVTATVLGKLITWMRSQSGTTDLRALLYLDEVAGYLPPTAVPPTKKPLLTLMKQARAFGVGVVLSTQNPVDLDYKAISNAGTWIVGRLQTEQDKARLLDGMSAADGGVDVKAVSDIVAGLGKRQFVVRRAGRDAPEVLTTRWAMSYLRGPLTREQIRQLTAALGPAAPATGTAAATAGDPAAPIGEPAPGSDTAAAAAAAVDAGAGTVDPTSTTAGAAPGSPIAPTTTTPLMPGVADGIAVRYATGESATALGGNPDGEALTPAVIVTVDVRYDDTRLGVLHDAAFTLARFPLGDRLDATDLADVEVDPGTLETAAPAAAQYRIGAVGLAEAAAWKRFERGLVDHLARTRPLTVATNRALKLTAEPGEAAEAFADRCRRAADAEAAAEIAKADDKGRARVDKLANQRAAATDRADVVAGQAKERKRRRLVRSATDVLGGLFGSKRSRSGSIGRAIDGITSNGDDSRIDEARNRVGRIDEQIAEAETALDAARLEIRARWAETAAEVTDIDIALEKSDIAITGLVVAWVPTR